jgi:hypothetical protein
VVPVYLDMTVQSPVDLLDFRTTYLRNSINERFVNTMLVESQSSMPVDKCDMNVIERLEKCRLHTKT